MLVGSLCSLPLRCRSRNGVPHSLFSFPIRSSPLPLSLQMGSLGGAPYVARVQQAATAADALAAVQSGLADASVFFYGALLSALQTCMRKQNAAVVPARTSDTIALLKLLTFNTVADVDATSDGVKALLAQQPELMTKLRLLSFLTLCSQHVLTPDGVCLSYGDAERALGVQDTVSVQRTVLHAVQQRLCVARLNERERQVRVYSYESRNVTPDDMEKLRERVVQWTAYAKAHLRDIQPS
ncbi:conserved hypothetical protein [Leishmania major strain Friedlin]|uniref:Uncharacterized protein n=1 Tax=Leishmania major TaxID=5664 RepID=Q4QA56_LEIMA|nr:conserved hypothetical protein [Leishmania major strain Friedlin]CAG9575048.1 hypothetical_protein_-_conserved [Leishmania major strain Friedlin]CAJ04655.1 conserved hypothetical protein [Leishmania major strain Friedlin]|eukprot:XP_001683792.1 conserved hypothetical protein [Leishmania major strain Friedlin]